MSAGLCLLFYFLGTQEPPIPSLLESLRVPWLILANQMRADDMWNWQAETVKCPHALLYSVPWPQQMVTSRGRSLSAWAPVPKWLREQLSFMTPRPAHLHGNVVWIQGDLKADTTGILGLICSCSIIYPILTNNNHQK